MTRFFFMTFRAKTHNPNPRIQTRFSACILRDEWFIFFTFWLLCSVCVLYNVIKCTFYMLFIAVCVILLYCYVMMCVYIIYIFFFITQICLAYVDLLMVGWTVNFLKGLHREHNIYPRFTSFFFLHAQVLHRLLPSYIII